MEQLYLNLFRRNDRVRRIKPNSEIVVSYFQNKRWRLITLFEELSGFWPYQKKQMQYSLQLFYCFIASTILFAVPNKLIDDIGFDFGMAIECGVFMLIFIGIVIKLILASMHQHSRRKVYKRIAKHFEIMNDPEEAAVLNKSAEDGFKYTLVYMGIISVVVAIFVSVPVIRSFYNYFFADNELRVQIPIPMNYGFDHNNYWYAIALDFITWMFICLLIEFTYDLSFILQVRHAAGLFKIVLIRLKRASGLVHEHKNEIMNYGDADESYSLISSAIDLHVECFEVVKLIEKSYTTSWFIILLMSTVGFGAGLYLITTKLQDPIETFRFVTTFVIVLLHFHLIFSQGQTIIDSAESVSVACCECKWYGLPKKSCKLLSVMMIRTTMPCTLTGAKLFTLSMESFSKMLKASLSYYTVFKARS